MSRQFASILMVGLSAFFCAGLASAALSPYYVTNVGQLPSTIVGGSVANYGFGMSSSGNYVTGLGLYGSSALSNDEAMGYCYNGSTVSLVASTEFSGWVYSSPPIPTNTLDQPCAVNNSGVVVGQYNGAAFYSLQGGAPAAIPGFAAGGGSMAYSINDNGLIVGDWDGSGVNGFTYNLNTGVLAELPGFTALSVNNKGEMAGCGGGGASQGLGSGYGEWRDASGNVYTIPSLLQANAIDSSGTYVVGMGTDANMSPSLYDTVTKTTVQVAPGSSSDNTPETAAYGVNSSGVVVGSTVATIGGSSPYVPTNAFVYAGGASQYVGSLTLAGAPSGIVWTAATAINDAGQMLVQGVVGTNPGPGTPETCILTPALPGDANLDGRVDVNDLTIVLSNYGRTGMTWSQGEFTGDGKVDVNDLTIVLSNYGKTDGLGASAAGMAPVPEPSCVVLLGIAVAGLLGCARRGQRGQCSNRQVQQGGIV